MKIQKYSKCKSNKYKVLIDDCEYTFYDDIIIKYNFLMKKEIDPLLFSEAIKENNELDSYYLSIKYITKKMRSEKEIEEYLKKKNLSSKIIEKTIKRLKKNNFLNDDLYLKAYINDQINLTNNGPLKIVKNLISLGLEEEKIREFLNNIDGNIWQNKIDKYINKKVSLNSSNSSKMFKLKIMNDLINLGYDKEIVVNVLNNYEIDDNAILKKEYEKAKKQLSKKYSGYELEKKIKERLYRKGFYIGGEISYEE